MMTTILDEQTNVCYFSKLLAEYSYGMNVLKKLTQHNIDIKLLDMTRDIWCRDFMPIQIYENLYVGYEYTPDYLDKHSMICYQTNPARIYRSLGLDVAQSGIILDGGNVIKTSKGIIMVDKVLEENRHIPQEKLIKRLETYFDNEIIFLPWDKAEKYGHADGIVREISNGRVLMTNYHQYDGRFADKFLSILSKHFDVEVLDYNVDKPCKYNWCYINFLRIGNKIFIPQLTWEDYTPDKQAACPPQCGRTYAKPRWFHSHIKEDEHALEQFRKLLPNCEIIPVSCPHIVEQGGALNCISWNIKQ